MRLVALIAIWPAIIALGALFGWLNYPHAETVVGFAAVASGIGFYLEVGLIVVLRVRSAKMTRGWSISWLLLALLIAPWFSIFTIISAELCTPHRVGEPIGALHLFHGESGMWEMVAPAWSTFVCLALFAAFSIIAYSVKCKSESCVAHP